MDLTVNTEDSGTLSDSDLDFLPEGSQPIVDVQRVAVIEINDTGFFSGTFINTLSATENYPSYGSGYATQYSTNGFHPAEENAFVAHQNSDRQIHLSAAETLHTGYFGRAFTRPHQEGLTEGVLHSEWEERSGILDSIVSFQGPGTSISWNLVNRSYGTEPIVQNYNFGIPGNHEQCRLTYLDQYNTFNALSSKSYCDKAVQVNTGESDYGTKTPRELSPKTTRSIGVQVGIGYNHNYSSNNYPMDLSTSHQRLLGELINVAAVQSTLSELVPEKSPKSFDTSRANYNGFPERMRSTEVENLPLKKRHNLVHK